jgi:elongation factor 2
VSDGALIVVDCVEGIWQTSPPGLSAELEERVKPLLFCSKLDRALFELMLNPEELCDMLYRTVERTRALLGFPDVPEGGLLDAVNGEVIFGSARDGWGFTLPQVAKILERQMSPHKVSSNIAQNLWGYRYYDPETKKIVSTNVSASGKPLRRFLAQFFLDALITIATCIMQDDPRVPMMLEKIGVTLTNEEQTQLRPQQKANLVLSRWLPLSECINATLVTKIPSQDAGLKRRIAKPATAPNFMIGSMSFSSTRSPHESASVYIHYMISSLNEPTIFFGRLMSGHLTTHKAGDLVRFAIAPNAVDKVRESVEDEFHYHALESMIRKCRGKQPPHQETLEKYAPIESCNIVAFS